jgi:hypothetical protein
MVSLMSRSSSASWAARVLQCCPEHALNARIACLTESIGLHADHFDHLAAAGDQFGQALAIGIRDRAWFGTNAFGEQGDDLSIERIGLGEPSGGTGEIPDLAWIDDREREAGAGESGSHGDLKPAGGLEHDQLRGELTQGADELHYACAVADDGKGLACRAHMNIETILRDIDADEAR